MATKLNFKKDGSRWVCELNPTVPFSAQVRMAEKEDFTVYAFIDGMEPVSLASTNLYDNIIFQIDVPEGVTVRMVAHSEVLEAMMV